MRENMEKEKVLISAPGWIQGVEDEKIRMAILMEFVGDLFEKGGAKERSVGYFAEKYRFLSEKQVEQMIQILVREGVLKEKKSFEKWMVEILEVLREVSEEKYQELMTNETEVIVEILGKFRGEFKTKEKMKLYFVETFGDKKRFHPEARKMTTKLGKLKIRYDLTEFVDNVETVQAFLDAVRDYCEVAKDKRVLKVLKKDGEVLVSEILRAVSGKEVWYYTTDGEFPLFHKVVTKYMFDAGYFPDFMAMIFRCKGIFNLRLDVVKFALVCWNYLEAIYTIKALSYVADEYGKISLSESAIEEESVRRWFILKVIEAEENVIDDETSKRIDGRIKNPERNPFFERNWDWGPDGACFSLEGEI